MNKVSAVYNQIVVKPQQFLAARKIKNVIISGKSNEITALIQQNTFASLSVKDREGIAQHILNNFNNFFVKPALFQIIPHIFTQDISKGFLKELFLKMIAHFDKIVTLNEGKSVFFNMMDVCDVGSLNHKEFLDFLYAILKNYHAIDQINKTRYFLDFKISVTQATEIASLIHDPVTHWKKILENNGWIIIQNLLSIENFNPLDADKIRKQIEQPIETFNNLFAKGDFAGIIELFKKSSKDEINSFINRLLEYHFSVNSPLFLSPLIFRIMKAYPEFGNLFTEMFLDNLESYTSKRPDFVSIILDNIQDTTQFIPQVKRAFLESSIFSTKPSSFPISIKSSYINFLNKFGSQNKLFIQNLKQTILEDFEKSPELIIKNSKSLNIIISLIVLEGISNSNVHSTFNNTIIETTLSKFDLFLKNEFSMRFLNTIITYVDNKNINALFNLIESHFVELIESPAGIEIIISIIQSFTELQSPDAIINLIIKHSDIICKKKLYIILEKIINLPYIYGKVNALFNLIEAHFVELIESPVGINIIIYVILSFTELQSPDAIINLIIKHSDIIREKKLYRIFEEIINLPYIYGLKEINLKPLISLIENNFLEFYNNSEKTLEILIRTKEHSWLIPKLVAYIDHLSLEFLEKADDMLPLEVKKLAIAKRIKTLTGLELDGRSTVSQTEIYLNNRVTKYNDILKVFKRLQKNTQLQALCSVVIEKERKFGEDYYTFVHGQRREYYWPERLFTFLYSLKKKQSIPHFFFAHVKDLIATVEDITFEKVHKNFLLQNHKYNDEARSLVLFMNYALFANTNNSGSNSLEYIINNWNSLKGTRDILAIDSFKKLGYENIYHQFKDEIEKLSQEYNMAGQYGNLLFIAIPKEDIHKYVYLAVSGATKEALEIEGIGETYDIRIIMDNLLNHPERIEDIDQLEFCLIMTQKDGGLDPNCGIHIYPILTGDPEKLAELKKKEEALFAKIAQVVKHEQQQDLQATALRRANILAAQIQ